MEVPITVIIFVWGSKPVERNGATNGVEKAEIQTSNGYTMEIKIPWSTLQVASPSKNDKIGLEIHCIDDEWGWHDHTRDNVLAWHAQINQERREPSLYNEYFYYDNYITSFYYPYPSEWGTAILLDKENPTTNKKEITKEPSEDGINIYPNPTDGKLYVHCTAHDTQPVLIKVFNVMGKVVDYQMKSNDEIVSIDLSSSPNGIYFIKTGNTVSKVIKK